MDRIAVSDLRANLMNILKKIKHGSVVDITSRGKVVAKLVPPNYDKEKVNKRLNEIRKSAVLNDTLSPVDSKWEALNK